MPMPWPTPELQLYGRDFSLYVAISTEAKSSASAICFADRLGACPAAIASKQRPENGRFERNRPARRCKRGPFHCVEVWTGEQLRVEVLDPDGRADDHAGMTMQNWRAMFGIGRPDRDS